MLRILPISRILLFPEIADLIRKLILFKHSPFQVVGWHAKDRLNFRNDLLYHQRTDLLDALIDTGSHRINELKEFCLVSR